MANQTVYPYGTGGSLPSNIGIVNDFVTGGADKALSAEAGKDFYEEVFGTPEQIDLSGETVLNGIIGGDNKWAVGVGGTCILLAVEPGDKFTIVANDSYDANYAFLAEASMGGNEEEPDWANGYSSRVIIPVGQSVAVTAPGNAVTLYIRETSSVGNNMLPNVYRGSGGLKDEIESLKGKNYESIAITSDYFNLHDGGSGVMIRAHVYMPTKNGCTVVVTKKASSNYLFDIAPYVIDPLTNTASGYDILPYQNDSATVEIPGDSNYFMIFFKNGVNNDPVSVSDIMNCYDISITYGEIIEGPSLEKGEKRWDFYGPLTRTSNVIVTDYMSIPKQFMSVRFAMPEWMRVRFQYGLRDVVGWTEYYYNGDVATFARNQSALRVEISFRNDRGVSPVAYDREAVGNRALFAIQHDDDTTIIERSGDAEKYLGAICATPNVVDGVLPVIVHTSDIHGDARRFNSAYDFADHLRADILINTGDNPFYLMSDGIAYHGKIVLSHKTDFANCVGNHDTYTSSLSDVYATNIAPFAEDYGYHKSSGSDITDKCYYYKDLSNLNIRIIAIDLYDGLTYSAYKARVSQTQMEWFIATLASTPAGYGVVVIMHQAPHTISAITGKTDFNDATMEPQIAAIDSDYMTNGKITGNPFGKIIDAFIAGGTVSGSYTQKTTGSSSETISYSADFSGLAEGVEFIAYLNGHTHRDFIGYVSDCEHNQLNLNIASTAPISQSSGYKTPSDIFRDSVGANQDAFNVYTINRTDKTVGVARIGSNLSKDLRPRKVMFVRYADDE